MDVLATPDAVEYIRQGGGRVYVWIDHLRWNRMVKTLRASADRPETERDFHRVETEPFEILFAPGIRELPQSLHFEMERGRRPGIAAYWNNCLFLP